MTLSWKRLKSGLRALTLALCAGSLSASPVPGAARSGLPSAKEVFEHYIEATGGEAAWRSKVTERQELEGRSPDGASVVLRASVSYARHGSFRSEVTVPQQGSEGVFNGVAWTWTPFSGAIIRRGADREDALRSAHMLEEGDWRKLYPKSRVEALEPVEGRNCYRVALLPSPEGAVEWFDAASGLLVRRTSAEASFLVEAWRIRDGLKQPMTMLATRGDMTYRLRVLSVVYNDLKEPEDFRYPSGVAQYLAEQKAGRALPNAEEIIERHISQSGGAAAYQRLKTQKITGTIAFLSRNMEARTETFSAGDGRYYQSVDIPGMGKQEEGSDGQVAWERSPILGPRAKPRKSLAGLGVTLDAAQVIGWRYLVGEVRTEAAEVVDGRECYRVMLRSRDGKESSTRWYDRKSGLLYRTTMASKSDMGSVPAVLTYRAWRDIAGLKWPVGIHMLVSGQELYFRAEEVALNAAMDDALFALPDEIRKLNMGMDGPR